jgi:hypothetical protein
MGTLKAETVKLSDITMGNFALIHIISVVLGSHSSTVIGYLNG